MHANTSISSSGSGNKSPATSLLSSPSSHSSPALRKLCCLGLWLLPLLLLTLQQQPAECRYLPTRSHGDDLDKLRELMLQILEASNEEPRPPNESNSNTLGQRAIWLNKLNGGGAGAVSPFDGFEALQQQQARKYATAARAGGFMDNGRYF